MEFDPADLERAVEILRSRLAEAPEHVAVVRRAAVVAVAQPLLPEPVAAAIGETADQVMSSALRIIATVEELLKGVAAPVAMFSYAGGWIDVKGLATDVQGRLRVDQLPAKAHWKGVAADRYASAITTQAGPQAASPPSRATPPSP